MERIEVYPRDKFFESKVSSCSREALPLPLLAPVRKLNSAVRHLRWSTTLPFLLTLDFIPEDTGAFSVSFLVVCDALDSAEGL